MENRLLGNAPFFAALPESDRARVAERMHLDRRTKGDWLFRRGEPSSELYLIQSGWVQLLGEGGTVIASLGPGSLVGEADLFLERPHSVGASLAGDGELWGITRNDLADLISDHPSIGVELSLAFGARLAAMERHLVERRLRALPALAGLGDAGLSALAHCLQLRERRAGERIVGRGQALQGLFLVESGQVAQDGAPLGAGQAFGEMALLMHRPHACEVVAQSDVVLWVLPAADFDVLCERHPEVRLALSRNLREPLTCDDQSRAGARLARMPLFSNASPEILAAAAERMWVRHVPAGELIYAEGTQGDALYLIDSGQVQIAASARPQSQVLATLAQDEFFGEMALLTGKPRSTAARAVAPTNLWGLNRADFDSLVSRYPAISLALTRVLSDRLAEADRRYTEDHLRGQKVLAGLSSSQLEDINRRLRPVHFDWGEIILNEGEPGDEMYFIQSGRVRVIRGRGRDARRLAELGAGELFGEMALLTGSRRTATVVAASDVNAWALARPDFDELVERYSSLALGLSRLLSERLRATDERLQEEEPAPQAVRPARAPAEPRPAPARPQPRPAARAQAERREPRPGLLDQAQDAVGSAAAWFGSLSRGAKVRLVALCLLLIWLFLIAAPAVVITALAANDVSDLSGAIAFVRSGSPQVAEPQAALAVQQPVQATAAPLLEQPAEALRGDAAAAEALAVAGAVAMQVEAPAPTPEPATPTPWIIVVTSTPPPATETPLPTDTPLPTATATRAQAAANTRKLPTATATARPRPARELDPRLGALNVGIAEPGGLQPGQPYWRLVKAFWQSPEESNNDHTIYIEVLDENGARVLGQPVDIRWPDGSLTVLVEDKPPPTYGANYPMYGTLGSYSVSVSGLPSDTVTGLGMGTAEMPGVKFHTNFYLTFKRSTW